MLDRTGKITNSPQAKRGSIQSQTVTNSKRNECFRLWNPKPENMLLTSSGEHNAVNTMNLFSFIKWKFIEFFYFWHIDLSLSFLRERAEFRWCKRQRIYFHPIVGLAETPTLSKSCKIEMWRDRNVCRCSSAFTHLRVDSRSPFSASIIKEYVPLLLMLWSENNSIWPLLQWSRSLAVHTRTDCLS